jgi:hypothetical protein
MCHYHGNGNRLTHVKFTDGPIFIFQKPNIYWNRPNVLSFLNFGAKDRCIIIARAHFLQIIHQRSIMKDTIEHKCDMLFYYYEIAMLPNKIYTYGRVHT